MHNEVFHYVQNDQYDGLERRQYERVPVTEFAEVSYNDINEFCKVQNLSYGGCRLISKNKYNPHGLVTIAFIKENQYEKYEKCLPVHGRIIGVHSSKSHKFFHYNIDFKGSLSEEHGIYKIVKESQTNNL